VLEAIVGCSGPDVVRDAKLFDMSKALEVSPIRAEDIRVPETLIGSAHTYPRRSRREDPW